MVRGRMLDRPGNVLDPLLNGQKSAKKLWPEKLN